MAHPSRPAGLRAAAASALLALALVAGCGGADRAGLAPGTVPEPGQVGYRGDPADLTVVDGTGAVPAGTVWRDGVLVAQAHDVVLENVLVRGGVVFAGAGVLTVRDSVIEGAPPAYTPLLGRSGHLDVRDSTIRWAPGAPVPPLPWGNGAIEGDATMTVLRCDISGTPDGLQIGPGNSLVEQNHVHDLALIGAPGDDATTHNDGVQSYGGPNLVIRHNRIDLRDAQGRAYDGAHQNGAVFVQPAPGRRSEGLQVVGNHLTGGGYALRLEGPVDGALVVDNRFGPTTGGWGNVLIDEGAVSFRGWSGNTDATGAVLADPS